MSERLTIGTEWACQAAAEGYADGKTATLRQGNALVDGCRLRNDGSLVALVLVARVDPARLQAFAQEPTDAEVGQAEQLDRPLERGALSLRMLPRLTVFGVVGGESHYHRTQLIVADLLLVTGTMQMGYVHILQIGADRLAVRLEIAGQSLAYSGQ